MANENAKEEQKGRTRNWNIIVYPDSAPKNWREILDEEHIEWVESPLHDKDVNPTGEPKKPHWHVLLMFGGVKSYEQVLDFVQPLNCPIPKRCNNAKSSVRYMSHLDHPDKAQYPVEDIVAHGGVDVKDLLKPSSGERYTYVREMLTWCKDNNIVEYQDLVDYAMVERYDDWFPLLCDSCTYVVGQYIKSARHRRERDQEREEPFDPTTGEILS